MNPVEALLAFFDAINQHDPDQLAALMIGEVRSEVKRQGAMSVLSRHLRPALSRSREAMCQNHCRGTIATGR